eukprot:CAMPEP_0119547308 /NCGR_PEP_ID=MMETSP1352-20130426/1446_1 /TAXON_ID=265584 /ORGANISM="Stauroneis constricta, Strain CCMP1120" /LENGTH=449 /DNA_ID=CAMNT_0007592185 /DNA_START=136 /DNA_END=1481 /DNA_ORIENTATION=+
MKLSAAPSVLLGLGLSVALTSSLPACWAFHIPSSSTHRHHHRHHGGDGHGVGDGSITARHNSAAGSSRSSLRSASADNDSANDSANGSANAIKDDDDNRIRNSRDDPSAFCVGILGDLHIDPRKMEDYEVGREHWLDVFQQEHETTDNLALVSLGDLGESKNCDHNPSNPAELFAGTTLCHEMAAEYLSSFSIASADVGGGGGGGGDDTDSKDGDGSDTDTHTSTHSTNTNTNTNTVNTVKNIPYEVIGGNHDLEGIDEFTTDQDNLRVFMDTHNKPTPHFARQIADKTYLVGLCSTVFRDARYTSHEVIVDDAQIPWFEDFLNSHPADDGNKVFVFTHAPPNGSGLRVLQENHVINGCCWLNHSDEDRCRKFIELVREHRCVKGWFSGHFHLGQDYQDSITFPTAPKEEEGPDPNRGSCVFVQTSVMRGGTSRDGRQQSRLLRGSKDG